MPRIVRKMGEKNHTAFRSQAGRVFETTSMTDNTPQDSFPEKTRK
jgi:hypothetical protein